MGMIDKFLYQSKDSIIRYPFLFSEAVCLFAEFNLPHNTIPVTGEFSLFVLMAFCSPFLFLFVLHQKYMGLLIDAISPSLAAKGLS